MSSSTIVFRVVYCSNRKQWAAKWRNVKKKCKFWFGWIRHYMSEGEITEGKSFHAF